MGATVNMKQRLAIVRRERFGFRQLDSGLGLNGDEHVWCGLVRSRDV